VTKAPERSGLTGEGEIPVVAATAEPVPRIQLIDARPAGLTETGLRARARACAGATGARFSSRSYSFPLALVAWHDAPVGVDIEQVGPCDRRFADEIRTPSERAGEWPDDPDRFFTSLWSSKEALSKALGDALDYDPRRLEGPGAWPDGRSGPWRARSLDLDPDYVAWLCWRAV
jgi:hypothetical protein